jgi:hypothetical protein
MHIERHLRPRGMPVIFETIYCPETGNIKSFKQYSLSPEPGEKAPRFGHVEDFTMDSLRNQIIEEPLEIDPVIIENLKKK